MNRPWVDNRKLVRSVIAGLLGTLAFWLSAKFLGPQAAGAVVEAAAPRRERPTTAAARVAESPTYTAEATPQTRLATDVRHNPFGQLNLRPPELASLGAPEPAKATVKPVKEKIVPISEPAPALSPIAPPLPFTAMGSIEGSDVTSGQLVAFLQQQDRLLIVRKGESIGQLYRVESVSSEKVEFTYLPLNQRQSLSFVH
jgi:hypothetical protein